MERERKKHALEYTKVLSDGRVFHYTCNAPSQDVLDKYGIQSIGKNYRVDSREVLLIPENLCKKHRIVQNIDPNVVKINIERMIRDLK